MSTVIFFFPDGKQTAITNAPVPRVGEQVFFNGDWYDDRGWKVQNVQHVIHRFKTGSVYEAHVYVEPDFDLTEIDIKR